MTPPQPDSIWRNAGYFVFGLLFLLALAGAVRLNVTRDASDAMLPTTGPAYDEYHEFLDAFPNDNGAMVVFFDLLCKELGWELIRDGNFLASELEIVERTVSLAAPSTKYVIGNNDEVSLLEFRDVSFSTPRSRCTTAMNYLPYSNLIVAPENDVTAIYVIAKQGVDATTFSNELTSALQPLEARANALGGEMLITGEPIMSAALTEILARESIYVMITVGLLVVLTAFATRSLRTALASIVLMGFVLAIAYGTLGWLGLELTAASSLAIFLLSPLSAAFVIHAHGYTARNPMNGRYPSGAVSAFALAGLSTAIGFACTGLTPAPDVQLLALTGVIGIAAATLGSLIFVLPFLSRSEKSKFRTQLTIPSWTFVRPQGGYALLIFLVLTAWIGLSQLKFEYRPADYLPMTNPARADFERIGNWFGRMTIPVVIRAENTSNPEVWKQIYPLVRSLREQEKIYAYWLYDHMSELTKAFSQSDANPAGSLEFPDSTNTFDQLLLWFDPSDLELSINEEQSKILLLLQVPFLGSHDYFELKSKIYQHLSDHDLDGFITGRIPAFFETGHRIGPDNLKGMAVAGTIIFAVLYGVFRSATFATIGILTNALPVLTALALLGILNVPIDMGSSIVAAMAFGIVLDDSTHILFRIRQLQRSGYDPSTAAIRAARELAAPVVTTTMIICCGFVVLFLAEIRIFHDFAWVMLASMLTAMLADLVILPLLVRSLVRDTLT